MNSIARNRVSFFMLLVSLLASEAFAQQVLNLNFGNNTDPITPALADLGPLSSPGGTFWNKVNVDGNGRLDTFQSLFDEFGNPIAAFVSDFGSPSWQSVTFPGFAPNADGVEAISNSQVIIKGSRPGNEIAIFFTTQSAGGFADGLGSSIIVEPIFSFGNGAFPFSFDSYSNPPSVPTDFGDPTTLGHVINLFPGSTIAAMQVRGEFFFVPEPGGCSLLLISLAVFGGATRCW